MLETSLVTALCRLDLGHDDEGVAGQERLAGCHRQVECLAAVCQRRRPPAGLLVHPGRPLERVGKSADGAFAARQLYRPAGKWPGAIEIPGTAPGGGHI